MNRRIMLPTLVALLVAGGAATLAAAPEEAAAGADLHCIAQADPSDAPPAEPREATCWHGSPPQVDENGRLVHPAQ